MCAPRIDCRRAVRFTAEPSVITQTANAEATKEINTTNTQDQETNTEVGSRRKLSNGFGILKHKTVIHTQGTKHVETHLLQSQNLVRYKGNS